MFWFRKSEGTLHFTVDEHEQYYRLVRTARETLAPSEDLSEAAIASALNEAIFEVADLSGERGGEVEDRVKEATAGFKSFAEEPPREYKCWIEVDGLDTDSLPARFGATRFAVLGDEDISNLRNLVQDNHTVDIAGKLNAIESHADEIRGRPVAIQHVLARDAAAGLSLATREVRTTIECLNAFADVIPYNRARLRIPTGESGLGSSLRMTLAETGSFSYSPEAAIPWTFSLDRLMELAGPGGEAVKRVGELVARGDRSPVEELLLRALRWVGRAADADSLEDRFLFSMIALETLTLPRRVRKIRRHLAKRTVHTLGVLDSDRRRLEKEVKRLYDLRSRLVHDGSREIREDDSARGHSIARRAVLLALVSPEVEKARTLNDLDDYFRSA